LTETLQTYTVATIYITLCLAVFLLDPQNSQKTTDDTTPPTDAYILPNNFEPHHECTCTDYDLISQKDRAKGYICEPVLCSPKNAQEEQK
jgi:hypothetical protein